MKLKISSLLIIAISLFICSALCAIDESQPVNHIVKFQKKLTGNEEPEEITLRITGKNMRSPFIWSVSIDNGNKNLFFVERNDAWLDKFFNDDDYVQNCDGYLECKKKWYFDELEKNIESMVSVNQGRAKESIEKWEIDGLETLAKEYLNKKGLSEPDILKVINEMEGLLSKEYAVVSIPISPVEEGATFMYVPSIGYFVPSWDD